MSKRFAKIRRLISLGKGQAFDKSMQSRNLHKKALRECLKENDGLMKKLSKR